MFLAVADNDVGHEAVQIGPRCLIGLRLMQAFAYATTDVASRLSTSQDRMRSLRVCEHQSSFNH